MSSLISPAWSGVLLGAFIAFSGWLMWWGVNHLHDSWVRRWDENSIVLKTPLGVYAVHLFLTALGVSRLIDYFISGGKPDYLGIGLAAFASVLGCVIVFSMPRTIVFDRKNQLYTVRRDWLGSVKTGTFQDIDRIGWSTVPNSSKYPASCFLCLRSGERVLIGSFATLDEAKGLATQLGSLLDLKNEPGPVKRPAFA